MKLFAPNYYKSFSCAANKCRHSCCIGWEIRIDEKTCEKYASLSGRYSENIRKSISKEDVSPHFALLKNGRCPHLDKRGLCRIITEYGENFLSDICREHPRFYNATKRGVEVGIGASCEEAAKFILASDGYNIFLEIGTSECEDEPPKFDTLPYREKLFSILSDESTPYTERLETVYREFSVSPRNISDEDFKSIISSLEYMNSESKDVFLSYSSLTKPAPEYAPFLKRALCYFIFRHCTAAVCEEEFKAALGFSLFCERLLASAKREAGFAGLCDLFRRISEELEYSEDNTDVIKQEFLFL